jgi:fucokinase
VITAGDALLRFNPAEAHLTGEGATVLSCWASPDEASRHGVYCLGEGGTVSRFLQKPSPDEQRAQGAMNAEGRTALDVGAMSLDARSAARMVDCFAGREDWIMRHGLDLYREICCAMGSEATLEHYVRSVRASGSTWTDEMLQAVYPQLRPIPLSAEMLAGCEFLHFGSTRQLSQSSWALTGRRETIVLNSVVEQGGRISGPPSFVEGCRIAAPLRLGGNNVVVGVDVTGPGALPENACLEVIAGQGKWFVRCYGVGDSFKDATFRGSQLPEWMDAAPSLWTARIFPAVKSPLDFRPWLWMFDPGRATVEEREQFARAERFSAAEIAVLADQEAFHQRRVRLWTEGRREP